MICLLTRLGRRHGRHNLSETPALKPPYHSFILPRQVNRLMLLRLKLSKATLEQVQQVPQTTPDRKYRGHRGGKRTPAAPLPLPRNIGAPNPDPPIPLRIGAVEAPPIRRGEQRLGRGRFLPPPSSRSEIIAQLLHSYLMKVDLMADPCSVDLSSSSKKGKEFSVHTFDEIAQRSCSC